MGLQGTGRSDSISVGRDARGRIIIDVTSFKDPAVSLRHTFESLEAAEAHGDAIALSIYYAEATNRGAYPEGL